MGIGRQEGAFKEEHALTAGSNGKRCHQCGKLGHIARNCRIKATYNKPNFNPKKGGFKKETSKKPTKGECFYCHKPGHMKADCFKYKRDQKEGKTEVAEVVLTAKDEDWVSVEATQLSSLEFPQALEQEYCLLSIPAETMEPGDGGDPPGAHEARYEDSSDESVTGDNALSIFRNPNAPTRSYLMGNHMYHVPGFEDFCETDPTYLHEWSPLIQDIHQQTNVVFAEQIGLEELTSEDEEDFLDTNYNRSVRAVALKIWCTMKDERKNPFPARGLFKYILDQVIEQDIDDTFGIDEIPLEEVWIKGRFSADDASTVELPRAEGDTYSSGTLFTDNEDKEDPEEDASRSGNAQRKRVHFMFARDYEIPKFIDADSDNEIPNCPSNELKADEEASEEARYSYNGDKDDDEIVETVSGQDRKMPPYFAEDYPGPMEVKASDSDVEYCADSEDDYDYWECKRPAKRTKTVGLPHLHFLLKPSLKQRQI
jgi:hypothetical protein